MDKKKIMYHFLPANFKLFDFEQLLDEENSHDDKKYVIWHSSSKDCKYEHYFNVGDICYLYYTNIPDGTSRILFRGEVIESDINKNISDELIYDNNDKIKGIKIGKIRSVALEDTERFNCDNLQKKYNISNFRSKQYLNNIENEKRYERLINDVEESSKETKYKLSTVKKYFDEKIAVCEFSKYDKNKKKHETFVMENGFIYYEEHHLIERHLLHKIGIAEDIIENLNNRFCLCPTCHMEIHHGKKEARRDKIEKLYNTHKEWFDSVLVQYINDKSVLEWLYEVYNANR